MAPPVVNTPPQVKAQTQTNDVGRHREAEEQVVCHGHLHNSKLTKVDHDKEDKGMRKPHLLDFHLGLVHCLGGTRLVLIYLPDFENSRFFKQQRNADQD